MLDTYGSRWVRPIVERGADRLLKWNFTPNEVTILGGVIGISVGFFIYNDMLWTAVALLWLSGLLDVIDGTMARRSRKTGFGTVLDLVFDRIVEISVVVALALRYPEHMPVFLFLLGSFVVAMTLFLAVGASSSKRSEKSFYYQPGLLERTECFILFTLMILFPSWIGVVATLFLILEVFTISQRLLEARRILR
ncbi:MULTISPECIES: CDP-alcohol phosphatidyltransferase family protein [unclassified Exiguobacterium]|uniref:CDP-alcohol phosphatidyltransferase family protein n=1 Tax=unclassified Exiguobacterium TaxID=2644629 RepID=UPI0008B2945D|nr:MULTISPECIES: CDP-alcohol phosphatidyltransferase family protein [unclassified Exiguobacterium]OGX80382.1 CDP-alcohol phosphatidyltransferase [Exiguobacterium sp. SH31]TCI47612.1 CDP-alcohol phosphatidyltransferase family protein [Exiguobacterium sp. SH5S32]TCI54497.1 CDP-alcohol phosphatidyltransferase family protein [Exiguobacterium sp. SH1S4]TCI73031.1 CDP-alcohol phosphatidyltransferase family protein [Exiguobacterium sp. SH0S7]TCI74289.1 CDP-alcohol phosphatidyltransferase family prote